MNLHIYAALMVKKYQNLKKTVANLTKSFVLYFESNVLVRLVVLKKKKELLNQHMACQMLQYLIFSICIVLFSICIV